MLDYIIDSGFASIILIRPLMKLAT